MDVVHLQDVGPPLSFGVQSLGGPPEDWEYDTVGPRYMLHISYLSFHLGGSWGFMTSGDSCRGYEVR
jgi:hypothetical protein